MKEDVPPVPDTIPKKRRQLEAAPDVWLAVWLARDDLTPSERRRVSDARAERRNTRPPVVVGIVAGNEGMTPEQQATITELLRSAGPTEVHHAGIPARVRTTVKDLGVPVTHHTERGSHLLKDVVRASTMVFAAPREPTEPVRKNDGVWAAVKFARNRSLIVRVILPNGTTNT